MTFYLEIANSIGCSCNCLKYCPQETIQKNYKFPERMMSLETFKRILSNVPKEIPILFAGVAEPFLNPNCLDMLKLTVAEGHELIVYSTLTGASVETIRELANIKFRTFCLHLPDGIVMKEPTTPHYRDNVMFLQTHIPNLSIMSMNANFKTDNHENVTRGLYRKWKRYGYCRDERFNLALSPLVYPNGNVYFCCEDLDFKNCMGNLLKENYYVIAKRIQRNEGKFPVCNYCSRNESYLKHMLKKSKDVLHIIYYGVSGETS